VFRCRFWLTLLISVPVIATSEMIMDWFGYHLSGVAWVGATLGTFVFVWGDGPSCRARCATCVIARPG
jgi:Cu2+-exporting ATPase